MKDAAAPRSAHPAAAAPGLDSDRARRAYADYVRNLACSRLRIAALIVAVVMPLDGILGAIEHHPGGKLRLAVIGAVVATSLLLLAASYRPWGCDRARLLVVLLCIAVAADVEFAIATGAGAASPYYTGLCLLVIAAGLFFPFRARDVAALAGATWALYLIPLAGRGAAQWTGFEVHALFIAAATLIAVAGAYFTTQLRERELASRLALAEEQERSESLLLNILPAPIAERLKREHQPLADGFADVTILFADIVGFTVLSSDTAPADLVGLLDGVFSTFDELADRHGLEKIKTIGDAYMVAGGLPAPRRDHAAAVANMALDMIDAVAGVRAPGGAPLRVRIGINSGPVVAGVIGRKKFIYDVWGDTVNTAARMESHGEPGAIQVTEASYQHLRDAYHFDDRGVIDVKGKGKMHTYFLRRRVPGSAS